MIKLLSLSLLLLCTTIGSSAYGQIDPDNYYIPDEIFERGAEFFIDEEYEKAYDEFMKVHPSDTAYFDAMRRAVECASMPDHYDTVIELSTKVIASEKMNPYREFFFITIGDGLIYQEKYDEAVEFLTNGIQEYPRSAKLHYNRSRANYDLEYYDEAVADLQMAIRFNPRYGAAHFLLGAICAEAGEYSKAALAFNMANFVDPSSMIALRSIGGLEELYGGQIDEEIKNLKFLEDEDFSETDVLLKNKLAENPKYKVKCKLKFAFIRHNHLLFEKMEYKPGDNGFWNQNYVRYFKKMFKEGHFENFTYYQCISIEQPMIQAVIRKKQKKLIAFINTSLPDLTVAFNERKVLENGKYVENNLRHIGAYGFDEEGKNVNDVRTGPFIGFDEYGLVNAEGSYSSDGELTGNWKFFEMGVLTTSADFENGELEGERMSYYGNGARQKMIPIKDDKIDGTVVSYYACNQVYSEVPVNDAGDEDGLAKFYFPTGEVSYKINYKDGKIDGDYVEYYRNGQEREILTFEDGNKVGSVQLFHNNGEVFIEGQYENDKPVGHWKYFHNNKQLREEGEFKNGDRIGIWKEFNRFGVLDSETDYGDKGTKTGIYKSYNLDGNLTLELEYKGEEVIKYTTYSTTGEVLSTDTKKKRELDFIGHHDNGAKRVEGKYYKGNEVGKWKFYNLQGGLIKELNYDDEGLLEGKSNWYFDNGEIEIVKNFSEGYLDGYYVEYYRNGKIYIHGWYKEGERVGQWDQFYRNGLLQNTEYYLEGEAHGDVVFYDEKGRLDETSVYYFGNYMSSTTYDTLGGVMSTVDIIDGAATAEFKGAEGKIANKKSFKGGKSHGKITGFYSDGTVRYEGAYVFGSKDGAWKWYNREGKLITEGVYDEGTREGEWLWYFDNGQIDVKSTYIDGNLEGTKFRYYSDGTLRSEMNFRNDEAHGKATYYAPSGDIKYFRFFDDGFQLGYSYLGSDGKPVEMIEFSNANGVMEAFFQNGKKSFTSEYKDGYAEGKTVHYHVNGKVQSERTYNKDLLNGVYKSYYATGKIQEESNYVEGDRHGSYTEYYANGKVKYVENYILDVLYGDAEYFTSTGKLDKKVYYNNGRVFR